MKQEFEHHQPRKVDKKKRHAKGFNEDAVDQRHNRINFKKYLEQVEQDLAEDFEDEE